MIFRVYATPEYYYEEFLGSSFGSDDALTDALKKASRHIDILTFNRIQGYGYENLTDFQKEVLKRACCELADFEHENEALINTALNSYSINGVSMAMGSSWNVYVQNGVAIRRSTYDLLKQTGLCALLAR